MSPDDRSKFDNSDNSEEDLFKKYSFDEKEPVDDGEYSEEEIIQTGKHAKRFSDMDGGNPEEEEAEKIEDDFFSDRDFDFRDSDSDDYDEDGIRSSRVREKRKKRRIIFTSITVMALLVLLAIGVVFGYRYIKNKYFNNAAETSSTQSEQAIEIPSTIKLGRDVNLLIACAGADLLEPEIKSVILSKYTASSSKMVSLCMPVNALFDIPGFGQDIMSKSVEFGGMDLMKLTVKNNLGIDVDNYLLMDVINIVNKLESIKLELTNGITITNPDGSKTELKEGENIINGETAYNFLNYFSGEMTDVELSGTGFQKILTDSIMIKIAGSQEGDLAKNLSKINEYIETDLSLEELAEIVSTISQLKSESNKIYTLEGRVVPLDEAGNIVIVPDISKVSGIFGLEGEVEEEEPVYETGITVSVTVLNGVGIPGIAGKVSEMLQGLKFSDGNPRYTTGTPADAENYDFNNTLIIVKSEDDANIRAAQHLAKVLMIVEPETNVNADQESDVVVIIGKDFDYDSAVANLENIQEDTAGTTEDTAQATAQTDAYILNILNGEGTQGIATTVKNILEDKLNKDSKLISVKETKNADSFNYSTTKIIIHNDKSGIEDIAQSIKDTLGAGEISESSDNPDNVDITVIVGSDYTK